MIISTGIAEEEDIKLAIETCRRHGNDKLALLKCTSAYPTPYEEVNLKAMNVLEEKFGTVVGLSDHTLGIEIPVAAVVLGAKIIEKHFILDKTINSVDKVFSLDPNEFKQMVQSIKNIEKALGEARLCLSPKSQKARTSARSLFVVQDVKKGELLTAENVRSLRPGLGLHPKHYNQVIGKKTVVDIERGTPLSWSHIQK